MIRYLIHNSISFKLNTKQSYMNRLRKRLLSGALGACSLATATAQDASKLYSVDHYTGVANISIPITSYQLKNNELGVSLSYNTKGVPVREFAGVAGLHWSLNAGGSVSRTVKGLPDEFYGEGPAYDTSFVANHALMIKHSKYKGRLVVSKENAIERANTDYYRDPESDEYYVSAGTVQFSFQIGLDGGIFVSSKERYDVRFFIGDQPYTVPAPAAQNTIQDVHIQVRDKDNGMTYYFSPSGRDMRVIAPYFRSSYPFVHTQNCAYPDIISLLAEETPVVNTWKLDKIISAEHEQVTYTYQTFHYPITEDLSWYQIVTEGSPVIDTFRTSTPSYVMRRFETVDLVSQIDFPYGKTIQLQYDTDDTRLEFQGISYNGGNPLLPKLNAILYKEADQTMKYTFDYSYFHTPSVQSAQLETSTYQGDAPDYYSLKLKGINVVDMATSSANRLYSFDYNDKKQRRFGKGLDFYGYYNGGDNDMGKWGNSLPGFNPRTTDVTSAQYAVLNTITTATGSMAKFSYTLNDGLSVISSALQPATGYWYGSGSVGDGLRINSIELSDVNDPALKNTISYAYSGGQYIVPGGNYDMVTHYANTTNADVAKLYRYENFMNPAFFARGTNHGYSTVTETIRNADNQVLSTITSQFTNFKDGTDPARTLVSGGGQSHVGFPFTRKQYVRSWELGQPLNIKSYDHNGLLLKEQLFTYSYITDTSTSQTLKVFNSNNIPTHVAIGGSVYNDGTNCSRIQNYRMVQDPYRPYKGFTLLTQKEERSYTSNTQYIADITSYSYDARYNMKSIRNKNSDGNYTEILSVYNYDLSAGSNTALNKMVTDDMDRIVATETWFNGTNSGTRNSNSQLLNASLFQYITNGNSVINKVVYSTALEQPLSYSAYMSGQATISPQISNTYNNGTLATYITEATNIQHFNAKGNPVETYVPQSETYKSMIWDTLSGKKTADVVNARQTEIVYAGFDQAIAEQNLVYNGTHLSFYNGSVMSLPGIGYTVPVSKPLVGKGVYVLEPVGGTTKELYTTGLESGKPYRATFWASANAVPTFGIEGGTQFTLNAIAQKGEYKQYEVLFSPTAASQKIGFHSNSGYVALEEIRIHPANAVMENYRYTPLFGLSVTTDALGRMTFYEYDGMGRLVLTRDQDGNILKQTEYGISAQY